MRGFPQLIRRLRNFLQYIAVRVVGHTPSVQKLPYPISVRARHIETEGVPIGGGIETFDQHDSVVINLARLAHLESLQLPVDGKTVLDVGCGVGHLAQFFVDRGCRVVCVDGREQNITSLRLRYPSIEAHVANVETEPLTKFGVFDIVFCYGLLYHLENPANALRNMAAACKEIVILETMVCDHKLPVLRTEDESAAFSQALRGLGCRPSPSYVAQILNRVGFSFVYAPNTPPHYRDFQFKWKNNLDWWRDGHPLRCVFVASRTELLNSYLVTLLEDYDR